MALFVFLTPTNSIAAEYFCKVLREDGRHESRIVPSVEEVLRLQPDFVMATIYDQIEEYILVRAWCEEIKKGLPLTKLIYGGPAFTSRPVSFFRNLRADYALRGEADFTFQLLVNEITRESPDPVRLKQIPGIMFVENGHLFTSDRYPTLTRDQLETLDFHHYCYYESNKVNMVFTERGCPFTCTYCSHVFGRNVRSLSVDRIMDIFKEIARTSDIKRIMFVNDNLVYTVRQANELFGKIIEEKWNERFNFHIQARIDNFISNDKKYLPHRINFDLIELLKKAGVVKISFGTESFSDVDIKRLKPEARYSGIDAVRLTRELGKRGIRVIHFMMEPSPDALPEEVIESTYRRLVVTVAYARYIEISKLFANPIKIFLIRRSGLYNRALAQDFEVTEFDDPNGKRGNILNVEQVEQQGFQQTDQDVYLPFLNAVNRFGTSANPYQSLLSLEKEFETLQIKQQRSDEEQQRLETLRRKIRVCRKHVNMINNLIKKIDAATKTQLKEMLGEIGGIGRFLQEYSRLPIEEKRSKLDELTKEFNQASLESINNVIEADTQQMFFMYVARTVKELISNPRKSKQVIGKYKRLPQNGVINEMVRLRGNTPLHIYTKFLKKDLPVNRSSIGILEKHMKRYQKAPW